MLTALSPAIQELLTAIRTTTTQPTYLVGGIVRDLLLGRTTPDADIDIVVEGNAPQLVRQLVNKYGGTQLTHNRFATATWQLAASQFAPTTTVELTEAANSVSAAAITHLDFATARTETYPTPASLPVVQAASIHDDLRRRDFSINAMALAIDGDNFGRILDPHNGQRHLTQRTLHVLHNHSLRDDPTRLLRAIRFAQRFNLTLAPNTHSQWQTGLDHFPKLTGKRIWNELEKAFAEPNPAAVMAAFAEAKIFRAMGQQLGWSAVSAESYQTLTTLSTNPIWQPIFNHVSNANIRAILWLHPHPPAIQHATIKRLRLNSTIAHTLANLQKLLPRLQSLPPNPTPSQIDTTLSDYAKYPATLLATAASLTELTAADNSTRNRRFANQVDRSGQLDHWQSHSRHLKLTVNGNTLRQLGLPPGPVYRTILATIRAQRLDGLILATEEHTLMQKLITTDTKLQG